MSVTYQVRICHQEQIFQNAYFLRILNITLHGKINFVQVLDYPSLSIMQACSYNPCSQLRNSGNVSKVLLCRFH